MLTNEIDENYIIQKREEIRNLYKQKGLYYPTPGRDWYENALVVIKGLKGHYGPRCKVFDDMFVESNMIATQQNISEEKYKLFGDVMEKTGFKILPVLSLFHSDYKVPFAQDGHTRSRLYHDSGRKYIRSFIIEIPHDELSKIEEHAIRIGVYGRPLRISRLPIVKWGILDD
jgi:hypothetical protein